MLVRMKVLAILASALLLTASLPSPSYALLTESIPFYVYDGVTYTRVCLLPATYFVAVEAEGEDYDRVTYLDMSGYIRHGDATAVDYEPATKYATDGKVTLNRGVASVYLYADAELTNVLATATVTDELFLYGGSGYEGVYYCRLTSSGGTLRGYIGTEGVTVSLPSDNDIRPVEQPSDEEPEPSAPDPEEPVTLALPVEVILSVSLAVPAFLLVLLLTRKK